MAGFTSVRDLGGTITPHLRDAINQGLVKAADLGGGQVDRHHRRPCRPHQWLQQRALAPAGPPGPTEASSIRSTMRRQAVRQRWDGSGVIKITATGGVLSYAKSGDAPQFTVEEARAIVDTARDYGYKGRRPCAWRGRHVPRRRRHQHRARHVREATG